MVDEGAHLAAQILLVENSAEAVRRTQDVIRACGLLHCMRLARDGEQALRMLRREGDYERLPRPDLILLDLDMPYGEGRQVLNDIKRDPELSGIPLVALSDLGACAAPDDAGDPSARCTYATRAQLADLLGMAQTLRDFWLSGTPVLAAA